MKYMLLIYADPNAEISKEAIEAEYNAYWGYEDEVRGAGAHIAGESLHPVSSATTVRVRDGKTLTTDGPFAETREILGGFYLVEAKDLDEAIQWAAKIPTAARGCVEVRPVVDFSQMQQ